MPRRHLSVDETTFQMLSAIKNQTDATMSWNTYLQLLAADMEYGYMKCPIHKRRTRCDYCTADDRAQMKLEKFA